MLGYRMFAHVGGDHDQIVRRGREQFYSWLREKDYDADLLEPGLLVKFGEHASGLLLERCELDGSTSVRARLVEKKASGRWATELTIHVPRRGDREPWILLDIDAPAGQSWTGTPRVATHLLGVLPGHDGSARLGPEVQLVTEEDVEGVLEVACDSERRGLAFVAGSEPDQDFAGWRRTVDRLLRDTTGLAAGYLLDQRATMAFNAGMGTTHGVPPRSVRTYLSGADPAVEVDALRHRILTTRRIDAGPARALARMLGQRAREVATTTRLPRGVPRVLRSFEQDIDDVAVAEVPAGPPRAPLTVGGGATVMELPAELVEFCRTLGFNGPTPEALRHVVAVGYRSEGAQKALTNVRSVLAGHRETRAKQQEHIESLRRQLEDAQLDHADVDEQRLRAEATVRYLRKKLVDHGKYDEAWTTPTFHGDRRVSSYDDLLCRIETLELVVFTGDRGPLEDLEKGDTLAKWAVKAWEAAQALEDYANAVRDSPQRFAGVDGYLANVPAGLRGYSSNRHAQTESEDVRNNPQFHRKRLFRVPVQVHPDGRVPMWAHFKLAQNGLVSPRMHYLDDSAGTGRIYIGYIGRHLPTKQTN